MTLRTAKSGVPPVNAETISNALSQAVHEHRLAPGTKLGEDELSDIYGVSRIIVRTALHALAHQQIIEIKRNRGAFVDQPNLAEAHEVFEARASLKPRTAARHATPTDIALLTDHIIQEHTAMATADRERAFHQIFYKCESQAHYALIKTIADHNGTLAEELMQSHLVDLHSALNLHDVPEVEQDFKAMLLGDAKR